MKTISRCSGLVSISLPSTLETVKGRAMSDLDTARALRHPCTTDFDYFPAEAQKGTR